MPQRAKAIGQQHWRLYRDNAKEKGNYYNGLYMDNGKEAGNYYDGLCRGYYLDSASAAVLA